MEFLIGLIVLAIVILCASIWYASTEFHTVHYRLSSEKISKPVKFVLLSDLHDKKYGKNNEQLLHAIDDEKPDAILIAGDMLTASLQRMDATAEKLCESLAKRYPVYYSFGNHEAKMLWSEQYYGNAFLEYVGALEKAGILVLDNESAEYSDLPIRIWGLNMERKYFKRFSQTRMEEHYVSDKLGEKDETVYNILLAHNPIYFDTYANWKPDLVLSGHLHGGLVRLPILGGVIAPNLKLFPKYDGGIFQKDDSTLIVSRGLGFHNVEFRMWNPGEMVVISLLPTKE